MVGSLEGGHGWMPVCGTVFEGGVGARNGERRLVSGGADGSVCVWEGVGSPSPRQERVLQGGEWVSCVAWGEEGLIACGDLNGTVLVWGARANTVIFRLP